MTATVWPLACSEPASSPPTRPHPTTTTCIPSPCGPYLRPLPGDATGRGQAPHRSGARPRGAKSVKERPNGGDVRARAGPRACAAPWCDADLLGLPGLACAAMVTPLKRLLVGRPLATSEEQHQRLRKLVALPVFASDAISSTAYATDEIVGVLLIQAGIGAKAFDPLVPIAIIVVILLTIVVLSYRQTIYAYPSGGGSYIVSRENLGVIPSLVAGSSLLVDYILTVAVSIAGGVLAIRSATGLSTQWAVPLCLICIAGMTIANLRGVRESGALFAPPTYIYVIMLGLLIVVGLIRVYFGGLGPIPPSQMTEEALHLKAMTGTLGVFMLLRAFSSGAVALSGVEAVSNGVPAFQRPESRNAARTLISMGIILGIGFFGISLLASKLQPFRGAE